MTEFVDGSNDPFIIKEFYVYELFDKRNGQVFYVGEGVRNRAFTHFLEADKARVREADTIRAELINERPDRVNRAKIECISQIYSAGQEHLGIRVVGRFDTKHEAASVEAVLINWVYGIDKLTNISRGRGSAHIRPHDLPLEDIPGIDLPKKIFVQGSKERVSGYLENIRQNHKKHCHFSMAEEIARQLTEAGITLESEEPCYWENGRYIALFVPLVPEKVRMIVQLTDSGRHQHRYNIIPVSNSSADTHAFKQYLKKYHEELIPKKGGLYCKLPMWSDLTVKNEDLPEIIAQVAYAQKYFAS